MNILKPEYESKGERPFAPALRGFTLVELMVALAIIAIITAISVVSFSDARMKGRDTQRVTDIQQLQMALKNYYYDEGSYPISLIPGTPLIGPTSGKTYLQKIPTNPNPRTDNGCPNQDYQYLALASSTNFSLTFCLGQKNGSLLPGAVIASADDIGNVLPCGSYNVTLTSIGGHACNTGAPAYDTCSYNTVQIGTQCWLKQNLNIGAIVTGTTTQSNNSILEKYCYNNTASYCQSDGGLYQWDETMQYSTTTKAQGICPAGWHIPNDAEQNTLDQYLTDSGQTCNASRVGVYDCSAAGTKLKPGGSSGFNGIIAGYVSGGVFSSRGGRVNFWSSSITASTAWIRGFDSSVATVFRNNSTFAGGYSVRCLQNCTPNCTGKACGDDGCSGSCGTCTGNNTCGGGGTANQCGCTAETDTAFCTRLGYNCGSVTANDNCGNPRTVASCGSCSTGQTCLGNICAGGLMASYDMSPSGSNLPDLSGNNHTGTISGPTSAENGLYFPTSNSYVNLGSFNPISNNSLSVAVTFKSFEDQNNTSKRLVTNGTTAPTSFTMQTDSNVNTYKGLIIMSSSTYYAAGPLTLPQGQITTLVGTYDNQTIKNYIDGTIASSSNIGSKTITPVGATNIYIGNPGVNAASKSVVYSVMIFNRALTSAEALAYHTDQINKYNTRIAGLCGTSTVAYSGGPFNSDGTLRNQGGYYRVVPIGSQCWLQDNMNAGTMLTGTSSNATDNSLTEKFCYSDNSSNCQTQGGLYQWNEAMQYSTTTGAQGICPIGWHIPSDAEQNNLDQYLTDYGQSCNATRSSAVDCANAGTKLITGGISGFNGLLVGNRGTTGSFGNQGTSAYFWSSSVSGASAWYRNLYMIYTTVVRGSYNQAYGFSVRCLKNCTPNCSGKACGDDGCGGSCGTCSNSDVCGGGGVANQCGFTCGTSVVNISSIGSYTCNSNSPNYDLCAYPTVSIGSRCWLAKNLNLGVITNSASSSPCQAVGGLWSCQVNNSTIEKYCYNNNSANCATDGGMYEWSEAMGFPYNCNNNADFSSGTSTCGTGSTYTITANHQGVCPAGWHVPTDTDYYILESGLATSTCNASRISTYDCVPAGTKINVGGGSGYENITTGFRTSDGFFNYKGTYSFPWTSSPDSTNLAWRRSLGSNTATYRSNNFYRASGDSIRCVKN